MFELKSLRFRAAMGLLGAVAAGCGDSSVSGDADTANVESIEQQWQIDHFLGLTPGHETQVRNGIIAANALGAAFPVPPANETCAVDLSNGLLVGNCGTDQGHPTLRANYGIAADADWHSAPTVQDLHFLRNYVGASGAVGGFRACVNAKDRIVEATKNAVHFRRRGDNFSAYFYAGHATHPIQDSFSPVHSTRQADNMNMRDVCTWLRNVPGVCLHDFVNAVPGDHPGLHPALATQATRATTGYLHAVWQLFSDATACTAFDDNCETKVRARLQPYFDVASDTFTGQHSCDFLPNQPRVTWTRVGHPASARKIAGCENGTLYTLNADKTLWKNTADGVDASWTFVTTVPPTQEISCVGNTLHAFDADKTFWRWLNPGWALVETAGGAKTIAGNFSRFYAVNTDNSVWTRPATGSWSRVATSFANPGPIAGGVETNPTTGARIPRVYMLAGGDVRVNLGHGHANHWKIINRAASALELSAGRANRLWALNTDFTLWSGVISE